jgi:hypothetical protein
MNFLADRYVWKIAISRNGANPISLELCPHKMVCSIINHELPFLDNFPDGKSRNQIESIFSHAKCDDIKLSMKSINFILRNQLQSFKSTKKKEFNLFLDEICPSRLEIIKNILTAWTFSVCIYLSIRLETFQNDFQILWIEFYHQSWLR